MTDPSPVTSLSAIDEAWLTRVLEAAGVAKGAEVVESAARSIGTGQVGENARFTLRWSSSRQDLPASVVGKFPSTNEKSLATAAATNAYRSEVGFYRDLQSEVRVRTPKLLHLEEHPTEPSFVLLMEDITPAEVGDQLQGCSLARAELSVAAAADLHASTWDQGGELARLDWLDLPHRSRAQQRAELYHVVLPGFEARYRDRLSAEELSIGRWLRERIMVLFDATGAVPSCLVHGDFRLDNLLFGIDGGAPPVTVVDWQTARLGSGPADVAYFVGAGLLPHDRRRYETDLLGHYIEALAERGVVADRQSIEDAYRVGTTSGYIMAVIASQIVEQTERGDRMFVAMASRHAGQIVDADLDRLLG